jgi:hypothetical protein
MASEQPRSINGNNIASRIGPMPQVNGATVIGAEAAENAVVHDTDRLL